MWQTGMYITSWAEPFLLLIDKERTNMAAPWGAHIEEKSTSVE